MRPMPPMPQPTPDGLRPLPRVTQLQTQVRHFLDDLVLPANAQWPSYAAVGAYPLDVVEPLKRQAQWSFAPALR